MYNKDLECFFHDEAYLVLICLVWISLGCMGSSISFEGEELLECKTSPRLLMDLEETSKNSRMVLGLVLMNMKYVVMIRWVQIPKP
jgi:hypothetical protein